MKSTKQVTVRQLQHNLADYLILAQTIPLLITKHGKDTALIFNPNQYEIIPKKQPIPNKKDLSKMAFVGLHKNKQDWKNKSSLKITQRLQDQAWYGK